MILKTGETLVLLLKERRGELVEKILIADRDAQQARKNLQDFDDEVRRLATDVGVPEAHQDSVASSCTTGSALPAEVDAELVKKLQIKLDSIELGQLAWKAIEKMGLLYVGDLAQKTEAEILKVQGVGRKTLKEFRMILSEYNLTFDMRHLPQWKQQGEENGTL